MAASPRVPDAIGNLKYIFSSNQEGSITAFAGGGQTSATQLGAQTSVIGTVASTSDSVKLPKIRNTPGMLGPTGASVGAIMIVGNFGANNAQIFGSTADTINGVATGTGIAIPAGTTMIFVAASLTGGGVGNWISTSPNSATGAGTFSSLTGSAATFPINGLAAAQGGSVTVTGGTSSTAGNNGGAVAMVGGTPGSTAVGGTAALTGGAGGSASGAGGAVSVTGGAGTAGNAAGGALNLTSGAGQGSAASGVVTLASGVAGATGASGAITITSGTAAGGATGNVTVTTGAATGGVPGTTTIAAGNAQTATVAGGAIAITAGTGNTSGNGGAITVTTGAAGSTGVAGVLTLRVGAATAGNGSAVNIQGGAGAGGTASGGNIDLSPGAAVSTGIPGEVTVATVAGLFDATWQQYLPAAVPVSGQSYTFFVANRAYRVKAASIICSSAGTVPTCDVTKDTGTTGPGAGTSVLTGAMTFSGSANTRVTGTVSGTIATVTLAAGDRLAAKFAGTVGAITGAMLNVTLVPC